MGSCFAIWVGNVCSELEPNTLISQNRYDTPGTESREQEQCSDIWSSDRRLRVPLLESRPSV